MQTQELKWLEDELIELAKQNPVDDYYVGIVGESLRGILKRFMGDRYPESEIDPPRKPDKRPDDPIGGMLWDEMERFGEWSAKRMASADVTWIKLLSKCKFPKSLGSSKTDEQVVGEFLEVVKNHRQNRTP